MNVGGGRRVPHYDIYIYIYSILADLSSHVSCPER